MVVMIIIMMMMVVMMVMMMVMLKIRIMKILKVMVEMLMTIVTYLMFRVILAGGAPLSPKSHDFLRTAFGCPLLQAGRIFCSFWQKF